MIWLNGMYISCYFYFFKRKSSDVNIVVVDGFNKWKKINYGVNYPSPGHM